MANLPSDLKFPFLTEFVERRCSDCHVVATEETMLRVNGNMERSTLPPPTEAQLRQLIAAACGRPPDSSPNFEEPDQSFIYEGCFFRINFFTCLRQGHRRIAAVLRALPQELRTLTELKVPSAYLSLLAKQRGLILVCGSTGSGKTTTLASTVNHINGRDGSTIITLENPIEIWYKEEKCRIYQRQMGTDFKDFPGAITACMRQDPDVILIGEMRDHASIAAAMTAAETGHLVLATMHSGSAKDAITRILDGAPDSDRNQQRAILSKNLLCVIAQRLVPSVKGGRVAAFDFLVTTDAVRNLIRNSNFEQIQNELKTGGKHFGMTTIDQSLIQLVGSGLVSKEHALEHAIDVDWVRKSLPAGL